MDNLFFPIRAWNKGLEILQKPIEQYFVKNNLERQIITEFVINDETIERVIQKTISFVKTNKIQEMRYSYKPNGQALLYGSCYAIGIFHLTGMINSFTEEQKKNWANIINAYQSSDGLFRDPEIKGDLAESVDWWGWRHLTAHVVGALHMLGENPEKEFSYVMQFNSPGKISQWLESRDWNDAASVSNEIQNLGFLLIESRDCFGHDWCEDCLIEMHQWLSNHQDPETGLWGKSFYTPYDLSQGVQAGYHIWSLFFYDNRSILYTEKAIESCLKTQNDLGGYGVKHNSSACEDIDSIDPLARWYFEVDYKRDEIEKSFQRALPWVLSNMNENGSWMFRRYERFPYGHPKMTTGMFEGSMFPSWFRLLSISYILKVLWGSDNPFILEKIPGFQFWQE